MKQFTSAKYLSFEEVADQFGATKESIELIINWLHQHDINAVVHPSRDFITATMTVRDAEYLLDTQYNTFLHSSGKIFTKANEQYSLPTSIADVVSFISGFRFPGKVSYFLFWIQF